jgi:hypothetical protein
MNVHVCASWQCHHEQYAHDVGKGRDMDTCFVAQRVTRLPCIGVASSSPLTQVPVCGPRCSAPTPCHTAGNHDRPTRRGGVAGGWEVHAGALQAATQVSGAQPRVGAGTGRQHGSTGWHACCAMAIYYQGRPANDK